MLEWAVAKAHPEQPFVVGKSSPPFAFGPYTLDLTRGALLRGAAELKLRPKSFETLKYLVLNSGRLVPKAELISVLWPDAVSVSDDSLTHCIRDVRRALGDDGQALIRNVPGRGYMFVVPTEVIPAQTGRVQEDEKPEPAATQEPRRSANLIKIPTRAAAAAVLIVLAIAGWAWKNGTDRNRARASISRVQHLAAEGKYPEGYDLALEVLRHIPAEPTVTRLMSELSDDLSISTTPAGAEVFLRRLGSPDVQRVGVTPIQRLSVVRGEYILSIRKAGYLDFERSWSSALGRMGLLNRTPWVIRLEYQLREALNAPRNMAFIPGGEYKLQSQSRPSEARAGLGDYFIDKFEVSNRDFKAFVDGGSYNIRALWPSAEVAGTLKDKTGLPGPRAWVAGTFPEGKQTHPVTGVTWFEAAAYCQSQGKDLPTLFQWEKAARFSLRAPVAGVVFPWGLLDPAVVTQRANFASMGTAPVDSFEFGMSPFGVYNMAGNVMEWVRNRYDDGFTTAGGAWSDPIYQFANYGNRPALRGDDTVGFRCSATPGAAAGDQGGMRFVSTERVFDYPVSTDREFRESKARYAHKATPLNAAVLATKETEQWRREEIAFDGYGGEQVKAFLYLPKSSTPPYQVIHHLSGMPWWYGLPVTHVIEDGAARMAPYIRSGRAMLLVVLKGFAGREPVGAYARLEHGSALHIEMLEQWAIDMKRGVDYLETRADIDNRKIAFWNDSTVALGAVFAALDDRYSSVIFIGAGIGPNLQHVRADVNPLHFLPHIPPPKLMLHGLYDDGHPLRTSLQVLRMMKEPRKHVTFVGGHIPAPETAVPIINTFLDEALGPVSRK
jgi:eukaryotic-like serine/threonine-protein kinase